jgi:hemerythrin
MKFISWKKAYSVNNVEIDEQHRKLFDIINRLKSISYDNYDIESVQPLVAELANYTRYHFATQEKYMGFIQYKDIVRHKIEHKYFEMRMSDLNLDRYTYYPELLRFLINFLSDWLLLHILEEDRKIGY